MFSFHCVEGFREVKARFTQTALAENRNVSGKRQDPGMSHRKLKALAERVSGNFLRLKPQAAELK